MERVPEPDLMLDPVQAEAYARADFSASHQAVVDAWLERLELPAAGRGIELGCGSGDILRRLERALPGWEWSGVDGSAVMLEWGAILGMEQGSRVRLVEQQLPSLRPHPAELLLSNSLLHHLEDPATLWEALRDWSEEGGWIAVADLLRPADEEAAQAIVAERSAGEPDILRRDFLASLRAAYTLDEVQSQLQAAGLELKLERLGDIHFVAWGQR